MLLKKEKPKRPTDYWEAQSNSASCLVVAAVLAVSVVVLGLIITLFY